jgi:transcription elongation GreA/GreB family factor
VHFGTTVEVCDEAGTIQTFTIVGEDEADSALGKLSWVSPLATALLNAELGELVKWRRPAGPQELEIVAIRPGEPE